jgi:hypothetical protein
MYAGHGQVYRLVTCGTVEEKILRNQIFKRGLHRVVLQKEHQQRYFTKQQLHALFDLGPTDHSQTHQELRELHGHQRCESLELERHRSDVERRSQAWVRGISDYHLLFTQLPSPPSESAPTCIATPSASARKVRSQNPSASKPDPARRKRPKAAPPSQSVTSQRKPPTGAADQSSDEEDVQLVGMPGTQGATDVCAGLCSPPASGCAGFCSPSHWAVLSNEERRRLATLLTAAGAAESHLLIAHSAADRHHTGGKALRYYLGAAGLLLGSVGEQGVTAEHQSKLLRLAASLGLSTAVVDCRRR